MKITLILVGKTTDKPVEVGMDKYTKRIQRYLPFQLDIIPALKNAKKMSEAEIKQKEGDLILNKVNSSDHVILLDEKGKEYTSVLFSNIIKKKMIHGTKSLVFVIGGAYGFSDAVYQKANGKMALSQMTFSHQLIRLIFLEQLYRAFTIINNEPYHHE